MNTDRVFGTIVIIGAMSFVVALYCVLLDRERVALVLAGITVTSVMILLATILIHVWTR